MLINAIRKVVSKVHILKTEREKKRQKNNNKTLVHSCSDQLAIQLNDYSYIFVFAYKVILSCSNGFSTIVLYAYIYRLTIALNKILNTPFVWVFSRWLLSLFVFFSLSRNSFAYLCSVIYFGMNAH